MVPVRMAELSREAGLPVPTIKFYLREGLLPPGERTSPNQARYSAEHVRRLRLVRALIEVGGLSVTQTRAVLDAMDQGPMPALGTAQQAMVDTESGTKADERADEWADDRYAELIRRTGWRVADESAAARHVRGIVRSARNLAGLDLVAEWSAYADHADAIARADIERIAESPDLEGTISAAVIGTVLGAAYLNGLRMLAHQHHSRARWVTDIAPTPHRASDRDASTP